MKIFSRIHLFVATICLFVSLPLLLAAQPKPAATKVRAEMLVSTDWLAKHQADKNVVVLHVTRDRKTYDEGHIPGARFLALGELLTTRDGIANELPPVAQLQAVFEKLGIGDEGRIILYGDNSGLAAARAFVTLDYLGHGQRTALLDGGLEKWKAEKREVQTAAAAPTTAKFTPRLHPEVVVKLDAVRDLSWVAANVASANVSLLDARPAEQYTGTPNQRSGHLPGSGNVYWMDTLANKDTPTLKPIAELRKLYETAGVKPGQQVVTYCNTGMQASHAYFTLKYLGYDVSLYDASFSEWSKTEGTPIVTGKERK